MAELLVTEWYERVEVALAGYHFVGDNGSEEQDNACEVAPELENGSQDQVDQSEELDGIAKLIAGVRIICYGNKCHI